jgi:hypothetical protein
MFTNMSAAGRKLLRWLPRLIPLAFIVFVVAETLHGLSDVWIINAHAQGPAPTLTAEDIKSKLDDLKYTLNLIVTAAGFFAVAQAAAAWFSSQTFTKQAEDALKRIAEIEKDVELRYPVFSDYEKLRNEAYRELEQGLLSASVSNKDEGYDWRENLYERMELPARQKLLSVERFIGIEFLRRPADDAAYTQNLQRLAHFYISKFKFEKGHDFGYLGDLERADYYLNLVYARSSSPSYVLNDLGLLNLEWYANLYLEQKELYLRQAETFFKRSCASNPNQQRSYYNLGVLESRRGDLAAAITYTEIAAAREVWEETAIAARTGDVYYNLACFYARSAVVEKALTFTSKHVQKCIQALERPAETGLVRKGVVDADFDDKGGDFYPLMNSGDDKVVEALKSLRPRLSENKTAHTEGVGKGKLAVFVDAVKNLFKT